MTSNKVPKAVAERLKSKGWTDEAIAAMWGNGEVSVEQIAESIDQLAANIPLGEEKSNGNQD